jgi:hypothetical protein
LTPGFRIQDPRLGSKSGSRFVKILKFFDADPGSRIRDENIWIWDPGQKKIWIQDPGWKKFGSRIWDPG